MIFKDSILLINASLDKLAKQFSLEVGKLIEPVCRGQGHDEYKDTNLDPIKKKWRKFLNLTNGKVKLKHIANSIAKLYMTF